MTEQFNAVIDGEYIPSKKKRQRDHYFKNTKNRTVFVVKVDGKRGYFKRRQRGYGGRYVFTLVKSEAMAATFLEILQIKKHFEHQKTKKVKIVKRLGADNIYKTQRSLRDLTKRADAKLKMFERELEYRQRQLKDLDRQRQRLADSIVLYNKKIKTANSTLNPQFDSKLGSLF